MQSATTAKLLRWWPLAAVVVAVALIIGLGGFSERTDLKVPAAPGQELDSRDLVFSFSRATAQQLTSSASDSSWEIVVYGTVRNPNDEALQPISGDNGHFAFKDPRGGEIALWDGRLAIDGDPNRQYVPPGNTTMDLALTVRFTDAYVAGPELLMAVSRMEYTDNVVLGLGGGAKRWNIDSASPIWMLTLPVTTLPAQRR